MNKVYGLLFVLFSVAILGTGAYIGGDVNISHADFSYSCSVFYLSVFIVGTLLVFRLIIKAFLYINCFFLRREKTLSDSLQEIISMILLKDHKRAEKTFRKLHKSVKNSPLGCWLHGHIQFLKGDVCGARSLFQLASDNEKISSLGAASLCRLAVQSGDRVLEVESIKHLIDKSADSENLSLRLFAIYLINKDFLNARALLNNIMTNKDRLRSIAFYEEFCSTGKTNFDLLKNAYQESCEIAPIAIEYVKSVLSSGDMKTARKCIEKTWKHSAHPDLFHMYIDSYESVDDKIQAGYDLVTMNTESWIGYFEFGKLLLENNRVFDAYCNFMGAFGIYRGKNIYDMLYHSCELLDEPKPQSADEILSHKFVDDIIDADIGWCCSNCHARCDGWSAVCPHCESVDSMQFGQLKSSVDGTCGALQVL